ncbi:antitoxin VbhA family protein [Corynebacterium propinquum]|uniref:antitoxin VbhA family protein n=1 Tax=Corynebacterium propinquum TaxID=43769 RepID=UPI002543A06B|nr:antitoxin VbhA family protein [Corynebacterium propinquum]MDK4301949.1 antitoxin VbhA family protein [Corynebacterium propinquum]
MPVPLRRSAPETKTSATPAQSSAVITKSEDVAEAQALADGALGAAGHSVSDPYIRELGRLIASGEISGDEAVQRALAHIDGF